MSTPRANSRSNSFERTLSGTVAAETDARPYHRGQPSRGSQVPPERRRFIAWDGEGINRAGNNKPQSYVLFGCSNGEYITSETHLHTFELLDFILRVGAANPDAFHVGFAFTYDANMVLQSLHQSTLERLHKNGGVYLNRPGIGKYYIQFRPQKWFSVTRFGVDYDRQKNPYDKTSVRIFDLFGFFQQSFESAYTKLVGPVPRLVSEGKAARGSFMEIEYVLKYWHEEIRMLQTLAETLRSLLYGAGLRITQWHGPGALASYTLRREKIRDHMAVSPPEVREAAKYAYAGGRFEMFRIGRTIGPVYSLDINSAYPYGIWQLPSLTGGQWHYRKGSPGRLARFGVYHVRLLPIAGDSFLERAVGPLFHRDRLGNISFPWILDGWYWSPEVQNLFRLPSERYEIVEGWEFIRGSDGERSANPPGATDNGSVRASQESSRPFLWVRDVYEKRREWKSRGIAGEIALKLQLNSLYGKMAQRVGWDEEKRKPPQWHQLEWAGWVTSNTRAMLWEIMSRIPRNRIIAVETDGLYTTMSPTELGIAHSTELGGWEVKEYDEILYVQSGMAWLRKGDEWTCKRRGLDVRTFSLDDCRNYLRTLAPQQDWTPFIGETTRFIGMGSALNGAAPFKVRHCVWETVQREIQPGKGGKRVHISIQCDGCGNLLSAYDGSHEMSIRSLAYKDPHSYPHDIPWEDSEDAQSYTWREYDEASR